MASSMGRRKKKSGPNAEGLAKGILGVGLLLVLWLSGGDLRKFTGVENPLMAIAITVLMIVVGLVVLGIIFVLLTRLARSLMRKNISLQFRTASDTSGPAPTFDRHYSPVSPLHASAPHDPGSAYAPADAGEPSEFDLPLVRSLEWRRFEQLVEGLFEGEGFAASRIRAGADGGVDLVLRQEPDGPVIGIVQCKTWASSVGVKPVRELFGVMAAEGVAQGHFVCCGGYTQEAVEWAKYKPMHLITGEELVIRLNRLPEGNRSVLRAKVTSGDYTTPTCPSCEIKMVRRSGKNGEFYGCPNYPRGCRSTLNVKA